MPTVDRHELALNAYESVEDLATALAQSGSSDPVVERVSGLAKQLSEIVRELGRGQERTGDDEAPEAEQPRTASFGEVGDDVRQAMMAAAASRREA